MIQYKLETESPLKEVPKVSETSDLIMKGCRGREGRGGDCDAGLDGQSERQLEGYSIFSSVLVQCVVEF